MTSPIDTTAEAVPSVPPSPAPKHDKAYVRGSTQGTINALRERCEMLEKALAAERAEGARDKARIRVLEGALRDVCAPAGRAAALLEGGR